MSTNTNEELIRMVKSYADEIEAAIRGELYKDENGEYTTTEPAEDVEGAGDREPVTLWDWIDRNALSFENWKINRDGECVGGEILLAFGGPNVWLDEHGIRAYWGDDSAERELTSDARDSVLVLLAESMPTK